MCVEILHESANRDRQKWVHNDPFPHDRGSPRIARFEGHLLRIGLYSTFLNVITLPGSWPCGAKWPFV